MLMTVLCALLGAYVGMNGRSRVTSVVLAAGLATAGYYAVLYAMGFLVAFAPDPSGARRLVQGWGVPGPSVARVAGAAAVSALVAGLLAGVVSPDDTSSQRRGRKATGLHV